MVYGISSAEEKTREEYQTGFIVPVNYKMSQTTSHVLSIVPVGAAR